MKNFGHALAWTNDCTSIAQLHIISFVAINGDKHPMLSLRETQSLDHFELGRLCRDFLNEWGVNPFYFNSDAHSANIAYMNNILTNDFKRAVAAVDLLHRVNRFIIRCEGCKEFVNWDGR